MMKAVISLFFFFVMFNNTLPQGITTNLNNSRFFVNPSFRTNLTGSSVPGIGLRLAAGYNITENLSIIISTGYMTSPTDARSFVQQRTFDFSRNDYLAVTHFYGKKELRMIPVDAAIRYSFSLFGMEPYLMLRAGWDFLFNFSNYDVTVESKYEKSGEQIERKSGSAAEMFGLSDSYNGFGSGIGAGVLIPLMNSIKLDISYFLYTSPTFQTIHSLGAGINFPW